MDIVKFTKEGIILQALMKGPLRYKELKEATGLSDAWLSRKLEELLKIGIVVSKENGYHIDAEKFQEALKEEKGHIAMMIAQEILKKWDVISIILFGSLARGKQKEADIDLLVVSLEGDFDPLEVSLEMFRKFGAAVDILHCTLIELLNWLSEPPPILFGILSGYKILYDQGYVAALLNTVKKEILKTWAYLSERELWLKRESLIPISKRRRNI